MKVIHKFKLASDGSANNLKLKHGYHIVHSEYVLVEKNVCIWVEQTLSVNVKEMDVTFIVAKSGQPIHNSLVHVASAVDNLAPEAYHIFRKPESHICGFHLDYLPHKEGDTERQRA